MQTIIIGLIVWFVGVIVAWLEIWYWNSDAELSPKDYCTITLYSFMSWVVYLIVCIEWIYNNLKKKR